MPDEAAPSRDEAARVLMEEPRVAAAADRLGLSEAGLRAWLGDPEFWELLMARQATVARSSCAALQEACAEATATLRTILTDPEAPPSARVAAARSVLKAAEASRDTLEIEIRIERMRETLDQISGRSARAGAEGRRR